MRGASLDERDSERRRADHESCDKYRRILAERNLHFKSDELKVFLQPYFDDAELYWNSVSDLLKYARSIADKRGVFSGESLLDLFNATKPYIMNIDDFEDPDIPFGEIFKNIVNRYLMEGVNSTKGFLSQLITEPIWKMSEEEIRQFPNLSLIVDTMKKSRESFLKHVEFLHAGILDYGGEQIGEYLEKLDKVVEEHIQEHLSNRCLVLISGILKRETKDTIHNMIKTQIRVNSSDKFVRAAITSLVQQEAKTLAVKETMKFCGKIDPLFCERTEFRNLIRELRSDVAKKIELIFEGKESKKKAWIVFLVLLVLAVGFRGLVFLIEKNRRSKSEEEDSEEGENEQGEIGESLGNEGQGLSEDRCRLLRVRSTRDRRSRPVPKQLPQQWWSVVVEIFRVLVWLRSWISSFWTQIK
jgi:hypothetical protein